MVLVVKNPFWKWRRLKRCGFCPWVGKIPWKRAWQPTPVFLPKNPMDRGAWRATGHQVTKSGALLRRLSMHTSLITTSAEPNHMRDPTSWFITVIYPKLSIVKNLFFFCVYVYVCVCFILNPTWTYMLINCPWLIHSLNGCNSLCDTQTNRHPDQCNKYEYHTFEYPGNTKLLEKILNSLSQFLASSHHRAARSKDFVYRHKLGSMLSVML